MRALVIGLAETGDRGRRGACGAKAGTSSSSRIARRATRTRDACRRRARRRARTVVDAPDDDRDRSTRSRAVDLVVPSPLVRLDHPALVAARAAGVPVRSEIDLAAERTTAPIVAVTGTNGKTTVTTLTAAMLDGVRTCARSPRGQHRPHRCSTRSTTTSTCSSPRCRRSSSRSPRRSSRASRSCSRSPRTISTGTGASSTTSRPRRASSSTSSADDLLVFDADDPTATRDRGRAPGRRVGVSIDAACRGTFRVDGRASRHARRRRDRVRSTTCGARSPHDRTNALAAAAAALDGRRDRRRRPRRARALRDPPSSRGAGRRSWWGAVRTTTRRRRTRTRRCTRVAVVRLGRAARGRPQQGTRPLGARDAAPIASAASSRSAKPRPRSSPRSPASGPVVHGRVDARRGARARPISRSRATSCCCRRRARRSTRTPNYGARGDDFADGGPRPDRVRTEADAR